MFRAQKWLRGVNSVILSCQQHANKAAQCKKLPDHRQSYEKQFTAHKNQLEGYRKELEVLAINAQDPTKRKELTTFLLEEEKFVSAILKDSQPKSMQDLILNGQKK